MADAYELNQLSNQAQTTTTDQESSDEDDSQGNIQTSSSTATSSLSQKSIIGGYESNTNSFKSIENVSLPLQTVNAHRASTSAAATSTSASTCNILRIGFLNDRVEERMLAYAQAFDIVVLGDRGFEVPENVLQLVLDNCNPQLLPLLTTAEDSDDNQYTLLQTLLNQSE